MADAFLLVGLVLTLLIGPWIWLARVSRRQKRGAEEEDERWRSLQTRLGNLEGAFLELQRTLRKAQAAPETPQPPPVPAEPAIRTAAPAPIQPLVAHDFRAKSEPVPAGETPALRHEEPAKPAPVPPASLRRDETNQAAPVAPPFTRVPETQAPLLERVKGGVGLEEALGANWLNKLGIVILVLGVAFFLAYKLQTLGPAGKVFVGITVSAALLGTGIFFERNERYRILARAGIGGGWALLFFTAYAMHHVTAARVIQSEAADLVLMMIVAAAMVWHTLRYNSQVVTGLAFLLAFATVNISRVNVFSLTAGVVLAAALAVLVVRRGWFELEIFGILATYLNHFFWLRPIIEAMHGRRHPFPEFLASAIILCSYWLIFRLSYIARHTGSREHDEGNSTLAALLNGGLLLGLMKYQAMHPEWTFWFLLGLGAAEMLLGQLSITRRRRAAFIVLTTLGSALLVSAIPFRYSGMSLSVLWIAEAQALVLAGLGTDEPVFRRLGLLAMAAPVVQLIFLDSHRAGVAPDPKLGVVCLFCALACYADAEWFPRRWPRMFAWWYEKEFLRGLSYAGVLMLMLAAWAGLHDAWVGVVWSALGFALAVMGARLHIDRLTTQANVLAAASLVRMLTVNVEMPGRFHAVGLRLITVSGVAALLYLSAPWTSLERRGRVPAAYTWAASFLVALLLWYELRPISVALGWALFGLALLEVGIATRNGSLLLQAYAAMIAAFARIFFVNLNASAPAGQLSPRVYTIIPLALLFFYAYERLQRATQEEWIWWRAPAADLHCWFGVVALVALMRFELNVDWVVAAWGGAVLALILLAWQTQRRTFLYQGLALAVGVMFRAIFRNFYDRSYFTTGHWGPGSRAVIIAAALLFATLPVAFRLRGAAEERDAHWAWRALLALARHPEQELFFLPLTMVTVLLALEMRSGRITVAWGIEGVAVFLVALLVGERSYRLAGLGLLLLCVGKIVVIDVWRLHASDRYVTFIILGSALLLVSFLYSRYRETLRQYL